ncbi:hypothetical protein [Marinomonas flavescens]|uniref:hypothetical protein n=1 Tax=Marinomonas flavescens TaxID=2529379 RepID=UPI0010544254|nr:hypothetical protein [Marinomonas flavescens]
MDSKFFFSFTQRGYFSEINNFILIAIYCDFKSIDLYVNQLYSPYYKGEGRFFDIYRNNLKESFLVGARKSLWNKKAYVDKFLYGFFGIPCFFTEDIFFEIREAGFWSSFLDVREEDVFSALYELKRSYVLKNLVYKKEYLKKITDGLSCFKPVDVKKDKFIAVHIRAGDKISTGEMLEIAIEKYVDAILSIKNIIPVIVFTDDVRKFEKLRAILPSHYTCLNGSGYVEGFQQSDFNARNINEKEEDTLQLLTEVYCMVYSYKLICTFSSNLTRYVALLKQLEDCISLDEPWSPF